MIIHQIAQARVVLRHIVPMTMQGHADEIQLQARIAQRLSQAALPIAQAAVIVDVAVIDV